MAEIRPVFKARISSIEGPADRNGDPSRARVIPLVGGDIVTRPLVLHWSVRGGMCPLAVGDIVWCARAEDGDGIVLCREDGEWAGFVPGPVEVERHLKADETFEVVQQATGHAGADFSADVTAGGVSLMGHTHTGVHGETSGPH